MFKLYGLPTGIKGRVSGEEKKSDDTKPDKKFTQEELDGIVQERLAREKKKYGDYDDLRKFKDEHEQKQSEAEQKALEDKKEYDKLKEGWVKEKDNYKKTIEAEQEKNKSLQIDHALTQAITSANAYPEAALALRPSVNIDEHGTVKYKGKDTAGNEALIDLAEGVKKFLEERPHLVKANNKGGGGTPPGGGGAGTPGSETELSELNVKLADAQAKGNMKLTQEYKAKINAYFTSKGIRRSL